MMQLRDYQHAIATDISAAWNYGHRVVFAVQATRTGKTVVFSYLVANNVEPSAVIAHRQELIGQTSLALARCGVPHRIIATEKLIRQISRMHVRELGACYVDPNSPCLVAAVKTLLSRADQLSPLLHRVRKWIIDEGHHVLRDNEWGKAAALFPNAQGLLVSATPKRADGKGLGSHADGLADTMVVGLQMREAIEQGWLLDYKIFAPPGDYHRPDSNETGADGELKKAAVKKSIKESHIVGDAVKHYRRIIPGKKAVVYNSDVETATETALAFNKAGIPAEVVSAKTDPGAREAIMRRFELGELLVLCNVDLFGEGTDMPDLDAVIMMRPTESFSLYCQQFNRASTISLPDGVPDTVAGRLAAIAASDKPHAIIIDHVGNVTRHGLPDRHVEWTLDAREKKSRSKDDDAIPLRSCLNVECMQVYERVHAACPFCGHRPEPAARSAPEFVDGDLLELDAATLAAMRGEIEKIDRSVDDYRAELAANRCPPKYQNTHIKRHLANQEAQAALRHSIAWWAAYHREAGRPDAEIFRRFYFRFGVDVGNAKALNTGDALALVDKINADLIAGV